LNSINFFPSQHNSTMAKKIGCGRVKYIVFLFFALWCVNIVTVVSEDADEDNEQQNNDINNGGCDEYSTSDMVPISSLAPNQFLKICPEQLDEHVNLGQPICGDGTSFGFFFQKPSQRKANEEKILLEFMGGGACWSQETCEMNEQFITFPDVFNDYIGRSCTEINYGLEEGGNANDGYEDFPINMLCADTIGDTDFSSYNTIIIPYCTQDVHIGDSVMNYGDDMVINHKGAHNIMSVLRWLFRNFKSPRHIALTGCSAGATTLPIIYDLIRKHYNRIGRRRVQISVVADSPVYLTPLFFLKSKFANWKPSRILSKVGFNYNRWKYADDYPMRTWDHILRRGNNKDLWGVIMHTEDPVALMYYEYMSGKYEEEGEDGDRRRRYRRQLGEGDEGDDYEELWSEFMSSVETVKSKHKNIDSYILDGEGHCSFGLYYPINEGGEDFTEWAGLIFQEQNVRSNSSAVRLFLLSTTLGLFLFVGAYHARHKREIELDDGGFLDEDTRIKARERLRPFLVSCVSCSSFAATYPITAAYILALSVYFWAMIVSEGFVHPINNPSLGPSAVSLSSFGINNPSLTLYRNQSYRLLTSNLLCSGIFTYLIVMQCLWYCIRPLERLVRNNVNFMLINVIIFLGSNLVYTIWGNGASCSSVGLVLGLSTVYILLRGRMEDSSSMGLIVLIFFFTLTACFIFPFNSWILILSAIIIGFLVATVVVKIQTKEPLNMQEDGILVSPAAVMQVNPVKMNINTLTGAVVLILVLIIISMIRLPNQLYLEPYYTGCDLRFAAGEDIANLASTYAGNYRRQLIINSSSTEKQQIYRSLEGEENDFDYDDICAQFCIPHLVSRGAIYGAQRIFGLSLIKGRCEDRGYDRHMADKTFNYIFDYSFDVEIFSQAEEEDDEG